MGSASDSLAENKHVMAATYDNAIAKRSSGSRSVKNAVAELLGIEQDRTGQLKELGERIAKLNTIKTGAQAAMQRRIDALRKEGKSKDEILVDGEFVKHKHAFDDASSTLTEVQARFDEKDADLKSKKKKIAEFKAELQGMQRANERLREEKSGGHRRRGNRPAGRGDQQHSSTASRRTRPTPISRRPAKPASVSSTARRSRRRSLATTPSTPRTSTSLSPSSPRANSELDKLLNFGDEPTKPNLGRRWPRPSCPSNRPVQVAAGRSWPPGVLSLTKKEQS
jgi:hypothetical protein